jgi:hypothetical protein
VKYDADHPGVDAGVLAIREWLLAVNAGSYFTCHGVENTGQCGRCSAVRAPGITAVLNTRRALLKPSFRRWFGLTGEGVKTALARAAREAPGGSAGESEVAEGAAGGGGVDPDEAAAVAAAGGAAVEAEEEGENDDGAEEGGGAEEAAAGAER